MADQSESTTPPDIGNPDIEKKISVEEFNPKGSYTLALIYFAILVIMWIFMYFVEFAGNGPSILQ